MSWFDRTSQSIARRRDRATTSTARCRFISPNAPTISSRTEWTRNARATKHDAGSATSAVRRNRPANAISSRGSTSSSPIFATQLRALRAAPGLCARRDSVARARHRRKHRDLQHSQRGDAQVAAGGPSRAARRRHARYVRKSSPIRSGKRSATARTCSAAYSRPETRHSTSRRVAKRGQSTRIGSAAASSRRWASVQRWDVSSRKRTTFVAVRRSSSSVTASGRASSARTPTSSARACRSTDIRSRSSVSPTRSSSASTSEVAHKPTCRSAPRPLPTALMRSTSEAGGICHIMARPKAGISLEQIHARFATLAPAIVEATLPENRSAEALDDYRKAEFSAKPAATGFSSFGRSTRRRCTC